MNAIPLSLLAAAALRLAAAERGYVDSTACRACHAAIFDSFSRTNMGRSFAPVSKRMDIAEPVDFTHAASGSRFTLRAGVLRHAQTGIQARVEWIVGSGAHSFTPLHVKPNGRLAELPLSWYSERGGYWAMSPGYDRPDHSGLRREISDGCLFCHNAYPSEANRGIGSGIDCQRCHGPGESHEKLVNPAKLPRARALEICLQCHLETGSRSTPDAIRRYDRDPFSFRPGQPLGDFQIYFQPAAGLGADAISVNGAGAGLLRSRCYQSSGGALSCVTCHDPHGLRKVDANAVCADCHPTAHEGKQPGCIGCHMPLRRTEDAVHVSMTDHRIPRLPLTGDPLAPRTERHDRYSGPVALFYPSAREAGPWASAYLAIAERNPDNLAAALFRQSDAPAGMLFELGRLQRDAGKLAEAARSLRAAIARAPDHVPSLVAAAEVALSASDVRGAKRILTRTKAEHPDLLNTLAVAEVADGRYREAEALLRRAIALDEWQPMSHVNLGVALQARGDLAGAAAAYKTALALQPDLLRARQLLAGLGSKR